MIRLAAMCLLCMIADACGPESSTANLHHFADEGLPTIGSSEQFDLDTGQVSEALREQYSDRIAGLYLERSQRRIVVRLTGSETVPPKTYDTGKSKVRVVFEPGAARSFEALNDALSAHSDAINSTLPNAHGRYVDERTGDVVILVDDEADISSSVKEELVSLLGAPVRIVKQGRDIARPGPAEVN